MTKQSRPRKFDLSRPFCSTQEQAAAFFGVHRRTVIEWLQAGAPRKLSQGYDLGRLARWRLARMEASGTSAVDNTEEDGADNDALERLRTEQWRIKKLERQERELQLVDRNLARRTLLRCASFVREAGTRLERLYGEDARQIIADALDEFEAELDDSLSDRPLMEDDA